MPFVGAARDAAAALAASGEPEADAVAALVDYVDAFGDRYCPKALEQVLAQAPVDVAQSLTDGITSFDAALPLVVQAAWLEADGAARELFATDRADVERVEELLSEWGAALEFAQAAFEAAGGLLPEEQDAVDRASDAVDVYAAGVTPFRPTPGVSLADVLRSGPVVGFESDAPVPGFHCIEIAPGGFEVIEEEFFPPEFPPPVVPVVGVPPSLVFPEEVLREFRAVEFFEERPPTAREFAPGSIGFGRVLGGQRPVLWSSADGAFVWDNLNGTFSVFGFAPDAASANAAVDRARGTGSFSV